MPALNDDEVRQSWAAGPPRWANDCTGEGWLQRQDTH